MSSPELYGALRVLFIEIKNYLVLTNRSCGFDEVMQCCL